MNDRSRADHEATHLVLDHIRPTVVVRRRAGETGPSHAPPEPRHAIAIAIAVDEREIEARESAWMADEPAMPAEPPAPAHLVEEMPHRLEPMSEPAIEPSVPSARQPTRLVSVGSVIAITKLAAAMGLSSGELVSELVTRGFFEVTPRSTVSREIARVAAAAFGWDVKEVGDPRPTKKAATKTNALAARRKSARSPKTSRAKTARSSKTSRAKTARASARPATPSVRRGGRVVRS